MAEKQDAIRNFDQLLEAARAAARRNGPRTIAVAGGDQRESVLAAAHVAQDGLGRCVLIGDEQRIEEHAKTEGISLGDIPILHETDPAEMARKAAALVGKGEADLLMKGGIDTAAFMRGALDKDAGLRTGRLLSHVAVFEMPN
jgi:phosphate butyryltransferase